MGGGRQSDEECSFLVSFKRSPNKLSGAQVSLVATALIREVTCANLFLSKKLMPR